MKKLLIPIDYHPTSEEVVKAGFQLAKKLNAEVCLVHVIQDLQLYHMTHPGFSGYVGYQMIQGVQSLQDAQDVAEKILKEKTKDSSVKCQIHVAKGDPAKKILEYADQYQADCIVLGTHSQNLFEKFLVGSVASEVLAKSKVPLYMIPIQK